MVDFGPELSFWLSLIDRLLWIVFAIHTFFNDSFEAFKSEIIFSAKASKFLSHYFLNDCPSEG